MPSASGVAERIAKIGYRLTGPRRAVLDVVLADPEPFTVEVLCERVPGVGRATVFRTVKLLQELDVVCRLPLEDGGVRYQLSQGEHHHHLICRACGEVAEFADPELDALIQANARRAGFLVESHSVELYGRCSPCLNHSDTDSTPVTSLSPNRT